MRIALVNCYSGCPIPPGIPPYGVLYVGSALKRSGHDVHIFDRQLDIRESVSSFCKRLTKDKYDIYGLGGVTSCYQEALEIVKYLKNQDKKPIVIVGGYLSSPYKVLLKNVPVDAVVHGEGEITAVELVKAFEAGRNIDDIDGISFCRDGNVIKTKNREQIACLDDIPFPDYSLIELEEYLVPGEKAMYFRFDPRIKDYLGKEIAIVTERGCTNNCTFCYRHMRGMRQHSPGYVLKHIKLLQERYGVDLFRISDELTISDSKWAYEFCKLKGRYNLGFLFRIEAARVDMIDEKMLVALKDAGMVEITFGIESGSQTMLNRMRKNTIVEENLAALNLCAKLGLQTTLSMIVGLPGENFKTIRETAAFLRKCPHTAPNIQETEYDDMSDIRIFNPVAFPGTTLYKQGLATGIIKDEHAYLCSLYDNVTMRSYNFTGYPRRIYKWWIHYLYFVYRSAYFRERKHYRQYLWILFNLIVLTITPEVLNNSRVFEVAGKVLERFAGINRARPKQ